MSWLTWTLIGLVVYISIGFVVVVKEARKGELVVEDTGLMVSSWPFFVLYVWACRIGDRLRAINEEALRKRKEKAIAEEELLNEPTASQTASQRAEGQHH